MKTIFKGLFIAVMFISCEADNTIGGGKEKLTVNSHNASGESDETYNNYSLIGKTTGEITNINGWVSCVTSRLNSEGTEYGIEELAKSVDECWDGIGMIILKEYIGRNGDELKFRVIDEIKTKSTYPLNQYIWTTCNGNEKVKEGQFVINFKYQEQAEFSEIYEIWAIDLKAGKFREIKDMGRITCFNPLFSDYL